MALAAYSIPKHTQASDLYSCEHENVSVYRFAHMSIMDHIRHTDKEGTDMAYYDAFTGQRVVKQKDWINSALVTLQADFVEGLREGYLEAGATLLDCFYETVQFEGTEREYESLIAAIEKRDEELGF